MQLYSMCYAKFDSTLATEISFVYT